MGAWKTQINIDHPAWNGYRGLLSNFAGDTFASVNDLNAQSPRNLVNVQGQPIRFVDPAFLPDCPYEKRIYETGQVSTRAQSWHDLFNALVWFRLPRLKAAMNAAHYENLDAAAAGCRGTVRDALTLFDESGVIVCSTDSGLLDALTARDWQTAFVRQRRSWFQDVSVLVCGHAILEKMLQPYKSMTAHAVFLHCEELLRFEEVDGLLADTLLAGELLRSTTDLSPVPLMGIPGWWETVPQDDAFYADASVFRPHRRSD